MTRTARRVGIVLFQLGGPDTLEAIEPFLYNLFCDPDIIDFPFARIGRKPLAKLISTTRARKVQHHYATIGGGSPIRRHTETAGPCAGNRIAESGHGCPLFRGHALLASLHARSDSRLQASQCDEVVLLPLYPQYSSTTTGSSLNEWRRLFADDVPGALRGDFLSQYDGIWMQSSKEWTRPCRAFPSRDSRKLFSAHTAYRCRSSRRAIPTSARSRRRCAC